MTFTYDLSTDIGKVRLRIPDTDIANQIFSDAEITEFLTANGGNVLIAAGRAVYSLASNQAYILKRVTNNGNSTDGPAVAAELRAYARELIEEGKSANGSATVETGVAIVRSHRMLRGY
jgi:hypothetical protein